MIFEFMDELVDKPDRDLVDWLILLERRNLLKTIYKEDGVAFADDWLKLLDDMRGCTYSRLVAFTWFERVRRGERI